ncbi:hypothetical protein ACFLUJ_01985 [Chloroflexota bacterium]
MRRGCISSGEVQCDKCHRSILCSERYLAIEEVDGVEVEGGKTEHYCIECAQHKGYADSKEEKGERILTFFPQSEHYPLQ